MIYLISLHQQLVNVNGLSPAPEGAKGTVATVPLGVYIICMMLVGEGGLTRSDAEHYSNDTFKHLVPRTHELYLTIITKL